jgi:anti-sigma B factor antagonist
VPEVIIDRSAAASAYASSPAFRCSRHTDALGAEWVRVAGELDLASSPQLRHALGEAQQAARLVVLDLRALSFIDGSGVHVILDFARDARQQKGWLLVVRGYAQVERLLTLTEVRKQVLIFDLAPAEPSPALAHLLPQEAAA